jgi:DNA-binding Lrp family transcriptional regulator
MVSLSTAGVGEMMDLTYLDRKILDLLQNEFPICVHPYRQIADILGIDETILIQHIQDLKDRGIIRRIGGIMDTRSIGYYSVLCACEVEEDRLDQLAAHISEEPGVTHNYQRNHRLNLWFTLTAPSQREAEDTLRRLENDLGVIIHTMPAEKVYKIRLSLPMGEDDHAD